MINIFNINDRKEYIMSKYMDVTDYLRNEDKDALRYLDELYIRVSENDAAHNSLESIIDLIQEDISKEESGDYIKYYTLINFLEADLINTCKVSSIYRQELLLLGKLSEIRSSYLKPINRINERSKPKEIKDYIDKFVIGQHDAKKIIATAVYNHMKRMRNPGTEFPSDVVLLIGPSGCGKTEIMRRIREITRLPMVFTDISSLGVSQTKGRHKEDILISLLNEARGNILEAEHGIIFLDEFDKLLVPAISSEGDDVHQRVQGQLLTMLEGSDVEIKYRGTDITFNTSHILFVLAGAFEGIEEYIRINLEESDKTNVGIGFSAISSKDLDTSIIKENINHKVLIDYGMKKELAGRIEDIAVMEQLKKEDYIRILKESKDNVIERYKREIYIMNGAELEFTDEAIEAIVENVMDVKIGARALTTEIRRVMKDVLYNAPSDKDRSRIVITKEQVTKEEPGLE